VVMMRQGASGRRLTSPVRIPTSKDFEKSRNFWLLMALMGDVYTAREQCCNGARGGATRSRKGGGCKIRGSHRAGADTYHVLKPAVYRIPAS